MSQSPASLPARGQFESTVVANINLCREHYRLVLGIPHFPPTRPGQFVQVACTDAEAIDVEVEWDEAQPPRLTGDELVGQTAVLRRPFSLAGRRDAASGVELELIHRVVGAGTDWLSRLAVGDGVNLIGPLGNAFTLPTDGGTALLVGGGVGIPPMMYLASQLIGRPAIAFCGALTRDLLALTVISDGVATNQPQLSGQIVTGEFVRYGVPSVISTDDGSIGFRGYVTQALEHYLDHQYKPGQSPAPTIYTCGPEPMMRRVADIAAARGLTVQIAVERAMACGMGTCQSCVIKVKAGPDNAWRYKLACTDGPVFTGADLIW